MKVFELYHKGADDNTDADVFWIAVPDDYTLEAISDISCHRIMERHRPRRVPQVTTELPAGVDVVLRRE